MESLRKIYWDTMLFIYWLEDQPRHATRIKTIFEIMQQRGDWLCSSSLVYAEVLVGPTNMQDVAGIKATDSLFLSSEIHMLPFPPEAAHIFAKLRTAGIKPPDAMHLAISAHAGVDLFITNDRRLQKLTMPGLPFITTLDTDII